MRHPTTMHPHMLSSRLATVRISCSMTTENATSGDIRRGRGNSHINAGLEHRSVPQHSRYGGHARDSRSASQYTARVSKAFQC